jgi:hypothetical protein
MAEKTKSGGGGLTWLIIGFLLGVVATLAALAFLAHDPASDPTTLGDAKTAPPVSLPQSPGAALPAPSATPGASAQTGATATPSGPMPTDPGADSGNSEMADDAAAAGMTSKAPPR